MPLRSIALLSCGIALTCSATVSAQHVDHAPPLPPVEGQYDGEWQGEWSDGDTWRGMWNGTYTNRDGHSVQAQYVGTFEGEHRFITDDGHVLEMGNDHGWHESEARYAPYQRARHLSASPDGRLAYTLAEREAWLADCRILMSDAGGYDDRYDRYDRGPDGGTIGGVLGAVAGGIAGNRIADGDRLLGTVVGGAVGAVAGAAIGSAIDNDGDGHVSHDERYAARYCDAYLRRYEMGGHAGFAQPGYGHAAVMVAAPMHGQHGHRHGRNCEVTVEEEWIEVEQAAPAPRPARRTIAPRPRIQRGKVTPIR